MECKLWLSKEELPRSINIRDRELYIHTDYRCWIKFESIMTDVSISEQFKPYFMISAVLNDTYDKSEIEEILTSLFSFYRLYKPIKEYVKATKEIGYRWDYDMDLILSAFRQQYQIDLLTAKLHWWEFSSLFHGLTKDTKFIEVVSYRTADTSKMPKDQKKQFEELKRFYALPKEKENVRTQEEIEQEILSKIKGGD